MYIYMYAYRIGIENVFFNVVNGQKGRYSYCFALLLYS